MEHSNKKISALHTVLFGGAAIGMVMVFLMQAMTTYTYDDYYYAVFLRDGFPGFLGQNVEHYLIRNGRVLVHVAAELLLGAGNWAYSLGNLLILAGVMLLGVRYLRAENADRAAPALTAGAAAALVLTGSYRVFRSWLLCPADSANYMLPLLAIFGMLLALGRGRRLPAVLLSLLCGATTELCAAAGFAAAALELLDERIRRGRWNRLRLVCLVCILAGLMTILLSPATRSRAGSELSFRSIGFGFLRYANSIAAPGTSLPLLVCVTILLGFTLPGKRRIRALGIPTALLLAAQWLLPRSTVLTTAVFGVFCGYLVLCAGAMILEGTERRCGFALLAGLCTAAIMSLSSSGSIRVTIPFVLMLILCSIRLVQRISLRIPLEALTAALLCAALIAHVPTVLGIAGNWRIMQENEAAMATGAVTYRDYNPRYCSQQLFMSSDFQRVYLNYLGLEGMEVQHSYTFGPDVIIDGGAQPSIRYQGRSYLPLRAVIEAMGGTVALISDSFLEIRVGEECFLYQGPSLHTPGGTVDATWDFISVENRFYISTGLLGSALGIDAAQWEGSDAV